MLFFNGFSLSLGHLHSYPKNTYICKPMYSADGSGFGEKNNDLFGWRKEHQTSSERMARPESSSSSNIHAG